MEEKWIIVYRRKMFGFDMVSSEVYEGTLDHVTNTYRGYKILGIIRFTENS